MEKISLKIDIEDLKILNEIFSGLHLYETSILNTNQKMTLSICFDISKKLFSKFQSKIQLLGRERKLFTIAFKYHEASVLLDFLKEVISNNKYLTDFEKNRITSLIAALDQKTL